MSTSALIVVMSTEWDGEQRPVTAVSKKFDGYPDTVLGPLKQEVLRDAPFVSVAELTSSVFRGLMCDNPALWQFRMIRGDESELWPSFLYYVWLERPGEPKCAAMPRYAKGRNGVPCLKVSTPVGSCSCQPGHCYYSGPLAQVDPESLNQQVLLQQEIEYQRKYGPAHEKSIPPSPQTQSPAGGTAV
jgi:hypothetical protein